MKKLQKFVLNGDTMGTRYSLIYFAKSEAHDLAAALAERIKTIDQMMTTYEENSTLMRLNCAQIGEWMEIPEPLELVLNAAIQMQVQSRGAFDIAIGCLVQVWGFGASKGFDADQIKAQMSQWRAEPLQSFEVSHGRARRLQAVSLDLSGIAKGYGVDAMVDTAKQFGITDMMASIDGELRVCGKRDGETLWPIAIEAPIAKKREVFSVLEIEDAAIATSGDYRHFHDTNLGRISHSFNPKTATPVQNALASVTVVAGLAMDADAWATALMVMGENDGLAFAQSQKINALFLLRRPDGTIEPRASGEIFSHLSNDE